MPLVKIWRHDRRIKKAGIINNFTEIQDFAKKNLGYNADEELAVVFESDGTEIDSHELFQCLVTDLAFPTTVLLILPKGEHWVSNTELSTNLNISTSQNNVISNTPLQGLNNCEESSTEPNSENVNLKNFQIPWEKFPPLFMADCNEGKRPRADLRREAVRQVIHAVRNVTKSPPRSWLGDVARKMVSKFPNSLGDVVGSKRYEHLFEQLENRAHHCNRSNRSKQNLRLELQANTDKNVDATRFPSKRCRDEYGCVEWQPSHYLDGETKDTQNEKKEWLKIEKSLGTEDEKVDLFMAKTYTSQRLDINKKDFSIGEVAVNWPYLFENKHFLKHANLLMAFDIISVWKNELAKKLPKLLHFFRMLPLKSVSYCRVKDTLMQLASTLEQESSKEPEECSILILLLKFFNEDESTLLHFFENTTSFDEILIKTKDCTLPIIAVLGKNILENPPAVVCIQGISIGGLAKFKDQILILFICFYVFNYKYHPSAAATLEFLQRGILNIDPAEGGHKRGGKKKRNTVHPKVRSLLHDLCSFESIWNQTE